MDWCCFLAFAAELNQQAILCGIVRSFTCHIFFALCIEVNICVRYPSAALHFAYVNKTLFSICIYTCRLMGYRRKDTLNSITCYLALILSFYFCTVFPCLRIKIQICCRPYSFRQRKGQLSCILRHNHLIYAISDGGSSRRVRRIICIFSFNFCLHHRTFCAICEDLDWCCFLTFAARIFRKCRDRHHRKDQHKREQQNQELFFLHCLFLSMIRGCRSGRWIPSTVRQPHD